MSGGLWSSQSRGKLFHFSNLIFLFVVHARNRHDLTSHVLVGNTTLRRRPCIGSSHDWTDLVLRAHGEAHLRAHATWQEVSLIVAVDRRRL